MLFVCFHSQTRITRRTILIGYCPSLIEENLPKAATVPKDLPDCDVSPWGYFCR